MPLELPANFKNDIQGKDTALVPIIQIGKHSVTTPNLFLSTNAMSIKAYQISTYFQDSISLDFYDINTKPLILNLPSLKESIDIEKRNYKISSVNLDISNFPYEGERFSELIGNTSLINEECRIFWVSPSATTLFPSTSSMEGYTQGDEGFQIYYGNIRRYTHDDEKVRLVVEDKSQATLHKDLPLPEDRLTEENGYTNVPNKYKGKGIPMVFGWVDKSPSVIASIPTPVSSGEDFGQLNVGEIELLFDSNDSPSVANNKMVGNALELDDRFYLYDNDDFFKIPQFISESTATSLGEDNILGFKILESHNQYIQDENLNAIKIQSKLLDEVSEGQLLADGNTIFNDCVLVRKLLTPANGLIMEPIHEKYYYGQLWTSLGLRMGEATGNEIVGTMLKYAYNTPNEWDENDWVGGSSLTGVTHTANDTPVDINNGEDLTFEGVYDPTVFESNPSEWLNIGVVIRATAFSFDEQVGYWDIGYNLYGQNRAVFDQVGSSTSTIQIKSGLFNQDWYEGAIPTNIPVNNDVDHDNISENTVYWSPITDGTIYQKILDLDSDPALIAVALINDYNSQFAANLYIYQAVKYAWGRLNNVISKEYYASVWGRGVVFTSGQLDIGVSAPKAIGLIMNHIGVSDIELPPSDYIYAFTVEKINSKKLIEGIASASSYIPRFNNMGVFKFTQIPNGGGSIPVDEDGNESENHTIKEADVIDFSFSKTKIEDVYTQIVFHYNWDYAIGEFSDSITVKMGDDIVDGYSLDYYGFKTIDGDEHAESTLEIEDDRGKYIRDYGTALNFALWYLMWSCNQHLKMEVKLPLKYMNLEVGDLVQFDEVIGGIEPFNINYKATDTVNEQVVFNTFLITSTNKTLDGVQIECVQMHNLNAGAEYDCAGTQGGDAEYDECGVCGGGIEDVAECEECPEGYSLDCNNVCGGDAYIDLCGVCDGDNTSCLDDCGVPNGDNSTCTGCTDPDADNYDEAATIDDGSYCEYGHCRPQLSNVTIQAVFSDFEDIALEINNDNPVENCNNLFDESPQTITVYTPTIPFDIFWIRFLGSNECDEYRKVNGVKYKLKDETDVTNALAGSQNIFISGWCDVGCPNSSDDSEYTQYEFTNPEAGDPVDSLILNNPYDGSLHDVVMQFEITTTDCENGEEITYIEEVAFTIQYLDCSNIGDLNGDGNWNVLDIVTLANCILSANCADLPNGCAGDVNNDDGYNVLDIVTLANCVLAANCVDT